MKLYTVELQQERKGIVRAFSTKTEALAWAKERVQDESIGAAVLWELTAKSAQAALLVAAEGKPWHDSRRALAVIARSGVKVTR